jgi:hypothetical protein
VYCEPAVTILTVCCFCLLLCTSYAHHSAPPTSRRLLLTTAWTLQAQRSIICNGPDNFECQCSNLSNPCSGGGTIGNDKIGSAKALYLFTMYLCSEFNFGGYMGPVPRGLTINFNGGNWRNNIASSLIIEGNGAKYLV